MKSEINLLNYDSYRIPHIDEFIPGFEYEYLYDSLSGGTIHGLINKTCWIKIENSYYFAQINNIDKYTYYDVDVTFFSNYYSFGKKIQDIIKNWIKNPIDKSFYISQIYNNSYIKLKHFPIHLCFILDNKLNFIKYKPKFNCIETIEWWKKGIYGIPTEISYMKQGIHSIEYIRKALKKKEIITKNYSEENYKKIIKKDFSYLIKIDCRDNKTVLFPYSYIPINSKYNIIEWNKNYQSLINYSNQDCIIKRMPLTFEKQLNKIKKRYMTINLIPIREFEPTMEGNYLIKVRANTNIPGMSPFHIFTAYLRFNKDKKGYYFNITNQEIIEVSEYPISDENIFIDTKNNNLNLKKTNQMNKLVKLNQMEPVTREGFSTVASMILSLSTALNQLPTKDEDGKKARKSILSLIETLANETKETISAEIKEELEKESEKSTLKVSPEMKKSVEKEVIPEKPVNTDTKVNQEVKKSKEEKVTKTITGKEYTRKENAANATKDLIEDIDKFLNGKSNTIISNEDKKVLYSKALFTFPEGHESIKTPGDVKQLIDTLIQNQITELKGKDISQFENNEDLLNEVNKDFSKKDSETKEPKDENTLDENMPEKTKITSAEDFSKTTPEENEAAATEDSTDDVDDDTTENEDKNKVELKISEYLGDNFRDLSKEDKIKLGSKIWLEGISKPIMERYDDENLTLSTEDSFVNLHEPEIRIIRNEVFGLNDPDSQIIIGTKGDIKKKLKVLYNDIKKAS